MNSMSSVIDGLASQLAERRQAASRRHAAYVSLARVILSDDQPELTPEPVFERQPTSIGQRPRAA